MSWQNEVDQLLRRRKLAEAMGGDSAVAKHEAEGRLTARKRIEVLLDSDSFREIGGLAGSAEYSEMGELISFTPSNSIIGTGLINGRKVVISADDFTIRGGSSDAAISEKWIYAERMALELQIPLIRLVNSAGGSVKLLEAQKATKIPGYPSWELNRMLGVIPVVGVALGSCAGLGAIKVASSHFSVMPRNTAQLFAAGPFVVKEGIGIEVDKNELGGSEVHARGSGVVDNEAEDEIDALKQACDFLSYLPQSVYCLPPALVSADPLDRCDDWLLEAIPRDRKRVYDIRKIISAVFDKNSFFEIGRYAGRSSVTGMARLMGQPVGVLANDPTHAGGAMTLKSSQKIETFVDLCDTFHIPIVSLFDQPGVMIGPDAERLGTIRAANRALSAIEQSRVPWCTIILRRAFGVAGAAHGRLGGINLRYAWPSSSWGSIPLEGGIKAAFRREIDSSDKPAEIMSELSAKYAGYTSPFRTAEQFGISDIIDPRQTRPILCDWIKSAVELLPQLLGPSAKTMRR